jgi:hypothetical protein
VAAIESSGYLLEGRIGRVLKERGFFVEPNGFRVDPNYASKTIEVDKVSTERDSRMATRAWPGNYANNYLRFLRNGWRAAMRRAPRPALLRAAIGIFALCGRT